MEILRLTQFRHELFQEGGTGREIVVLPAGLHVVGGACPVVADEVEPLDLGMFP